MAQPTQQQLQLARITMRQMQPLILLGLCLVSSAGTSSAQTQSQPQAPIPQAPAANQAEVASPDAIISSVYDVISGPAGQKRDWVACVRSSIPARV